MKLRRLLFLTVLAIAANAVASAVVDVTPDKPTSEFVQENYVNNETELITGSQIILTEMDSALGVIGTEKVRSEQYFSIADKLEKSMPTKWLDWNILQSANFLHNNDRFHIVFMTSNRKSSITPNVTMHELLLFVVNCEKGVVYGTYKTLSQSAGSSSKVVQSLPLSIDTPMARDDVQYHPLIDATCGTHTVQDLIDEATDKKKILLGIEVFWNPKGWVIIRRVDDHAYTIVRKADRQYYEAN